MILESKDHDKLGHLACSLHLFCNAAHKNTHWTMCLSSFLKIEAIFYVEKYLDHCRRKSFLNCVRLFTMELPFSKISTCERIWLHHFFGIIKVHMWSNSDVSFLKFNYFHWYGWKRYNLGHGINEGWTQKVSTFHSYFHAHAFWRDMFENMT